MKRFLLLLFITSLFLSCGQSKSQKDPDATVFYLIRHAEKDRSDKTNRDPNLKQAGKERAKGWAKHFEDIELDKIYSTDYNRTKQTARPTAKSKKLTLEFYNPSKIDGDAFIANNKGKSVLVVGHSNTTPMFANALLGKKMYEDFDDSVNSNLIVVTIDKNGNKTSSISQVN